MNNTLNRLIHDKALNIVYFGGSITYGSGATDFNKTSWRAITAEWFRKSYPNCAIKDINAGVGGTGSDLGVFRCRRDVLSSNPDLVFVEFAVNDNNKDKTKTAAAMEGIIRALINKNPKVDIVFIYTTQMVMYEDYLAGRTTGSIDAHRSVAAHYKIPEINVGQAMMESIIRGEGTWEEYTPDGTHPSDRGYALYADCIINFLKQELSRQGTEALRTLPEKLNYKALDIADLQDSWLAQGDGWIKVDESLKGVYPHMLVCNEPGKKLTFKFKGNSIGLYWMIASDSGDIEWDIDGKYKGKASSWDKYALSFDRANYSVLSNDLEAGEHELTLVVSEEKNPKSQGHYIRIGAFLVGGHL